MGDSVMPQSLRQLPGEQGSPWPCSLIEAAFFEFGPRQRWVELQCVQKLDEWIWIGLAEGDKT